ncbi:MAG: sulfite exporter TauE/SafE family protein [Desulfobacteraceae bacterium]|nr:sulfite exporter TauE/SafE family protein [Desulfobacteraceae bacterium]
MLVNDIVYASIVIVFASFSQSISGIGFVMVATPFLLPILNVKDTILITFSVSLISQILIVYKHWRVIHPRMFLNFVIGSALGAPAGLWLFSVASFETLKLILGVSLFSISSFSIHRLYKNWSVMDGCTTCRISPEAPMPWNRKELLRCVSDRAGKIQLLTGTLAGFFGLGIGMAGVPLTVYFSVANIDKDVARATTLSFFIVLCALTLGANYGFGAIGETVYTMVPLLVPSLLIGMAAGNMVFPHIPQRWFQLILNSIILYSACKILIESF